MYEILKILKPETDLINFTPGIPKQISINRRYEIMLRNPILKLHNHQTVDIPALANHRIISWFSNYCCKVEVPISRECSLLELVSNST